MPVRPIRQPAPGLAALTPRGSCRLRIHRIRAIARDHSAVCLPLPMRSLDPATLTFPLPGGDLLGKTFPQVPAALEESEERIVLPIAQEKSGTAGPSEEADLVEAVRAGDIEAYAQIYVRHAAAALACALRNCRSRCAAEDVRAEAFTAMLAAIRAGRGPRGPVLPYLRTAIRRIAAEWRRRDARVLPVGDARCLEDRVAASDSAAARAQMTIAAEAFSALPERWRAVLQHTVIEANGPGQVCAQFGVSAAALAALAYRAREGLRETYLQAHIRHLADEACRPFAERLGAYTRGRAGRSQRLCIGRHLAACTDCSNLLAMLCRVNSTMACSRPPTRRRT